MNAPDHRLTPARSCTGGGPPLPGGGGYLSAAPVGSAVLALRRVSSPRAHGAAFLVVVLALVTACNTTSQTTQGPRPSAEVIVQDAVGDLLIQVSAIQSDAVLAHDSRVMTEDPILHARHRQTLQGSARGIKASFKALAAWKATAGSSAPLKVLEQLLPVLPDLFDVAITLGVTDSPTIVKIQKVLEGFRGGVK